MLKNLYAADAKATEYADLAAHGLGHNRTELGWYLGNKTEKHGYEALTAYEQK